MWRFINNQDVGSEAATIQRVRNSSLVERLCAENIRGSSTEPKSRQQRKLLGRGAFHGRRRLTGRTAGAVSSEYAGVSSDKIGENPIHRKPKVSRGKARPPWVSRDLR